MCHTLRHQVWTRTREQPSVLRSGEPSVVSIIARTVRYFLFSGASVNIVALEV